MKDQPWDLNQTWHVRRKWCRFINAPQKFRGPSPKNLGSKKTSHFDHFSRDFRTRHPISPERNVASTNQNTAVNLQYVLYKLIYFPLPLTQKRLRFFGSFRPTHENSAFFQLVSKKSATVQSFLCKNVQRQSCVDIIPLSNGT